MVTLGFNNKIKIDDAAKYLACSRPAVVLAIRKNKLKAQKLGKEWIIDHKDLEHAKATRLIVGRVKRKESDKQQHQSETFTRPIAIPKTANGLCVFVEVDRSKYALINLILKKSNKTLETLLTEKVESIHSEIMSKLEGINL